MVLQRFLHISQAKLLVVHSATERGPSSTSGDAAVLSRSEEESTTVALTCQAKHLADCSLVGHRSRAPNVQSLVVADFSSGTASEAVLEQRAIAHFCYYVSTNILCEHFNFCVGTVIFLCAQFYFVKNCYVACVNLQSFKNPQVVGQSARVLKEGEIFSKSNEVIGKSTKSAKFLEKALSFCKIREKCKVFGKSTLFKNCTVFLYCT
jgi:hypothetical protein